MPSQQVFRLAGPHSTYHELQTFDEPIPTISNREVLIRVRAVALNYRDLAISKSLYPFPVKDQVVPCSDAAGEIVEVGSAITKDLAKGDTVVGAFDPTALYGPMRDWDNGQGGPVDGVLRQYIVLPAEAVVKVPKESNLSHAQWASLVCTGVTAWNALYGNLPLKPGQTVLFQGTGGVSITGLILAKAAGATTIITSSSDEKLKHVQARYGADHVINYKKTPDWAAEAQRITGGRGVDFVLENGGAGTIKQSIEAIAMGGIISVIGFLASIPQSEMPDVALLALSKNAVVRGIMVGSKQMLEDVVRFVGERGLDIPVEKTFGFTRDEVVKAYEYLESAQHIGKVCINVD
ncbi:putative zinc-type alcohol dehydrogenase-like protein [Diplodia seriata]|uniref:Putative zinc-type alcohol dehydrogenase-like protein n=1 Tax=Diplodia seriata TaxID=420778 RepID=A0A0G2EVA6_9PEZI|nr:putative zinc-type alcohol dehydrogenase-like protein [Diplodia seriata]